MSEQSQVVPEGAVEAALNALMPKLFSSNPADTTESGVRDALAAALPHLLAANPAQAVGAQVGVPPPCKYPKPDENGNDTCVDAHNYADGWNDCRRAMLAAAPKPAAEGALATTGVKGAPATRGGVADEPDEAVAPIALPEWYVQQSDVRQAVAQEVALLVPKGDVDHCAHCLSWIGGPLMCCGKYQIGRRLITKREAVAERILRVFGQFSLAIAAHEPDEAVVRDAERYRTWRHAFREGDCNLYNAICEAQSESEHDAAIDAAMAKGSG